ncbi:MAG: nuclear transport factor 2 family protein [Alphaproteobacteria bacterium]|nr:nuclear transport factor 2 family protein [Alphaproteobacteria bacterium]
MVQASVPEIADRMAVIDTATRYARCLDAKDWAGFRACFTDQLETDFADFGTPAQTAPAEDFVAIDQRILADVDTQHLIVNHHVTLTGDEAVLIAEAIAAHHRRPDRGGGDYDVHGTYRMVMRRTGRVADLRRAAAPALA